ncbi:MAG: SGNH/GDSL hydrolase family protein [Phycicoccus sp.]|nr:SGNH/GDSL hydrolase family protein [Phycicoccus sp.]NMM34534.1 SGNH/GDSL hydrolase family protein [Phycicoccus sp.]
MPLRLVAIGDSTVEGLEDPGPDGVYIGWADRFARHLNAMHPGLLYANLAVRGETAHEVRERQLGPALDLAPDFAVVAAGVNDILRPRLDRDALREDLCAMHAGLAATGARVLSFTMPDMTRVAPLAVVLSGRLQFLNAVTLECRERYGSIVVDLAAASAAGHPALWHTDRLHANSEGHRRIAAALAEALGYEVEDWRAEPPAMPKLSPLRVALTEAAWAGSHLLPWAWEHLRGQSSGDGVACKRPNLLPVT